MRLRRHILTATAALAGLACSALTVAASSIFTVLPPLGAGLPSATHMPAAGPWMLAPGEYYTEIAGSAYETRSAFDDNGDRVTYDGTAQQREFRSYTELGWKKKLSFQMTLPIVTNSLLVGSPSPSATGFGDAGFGFRYALASGAEAIAVQLAWEVPTGYNRRLYPALGDGLQKLTAAVQLGGPLYKGGFWQASAGYRYEYASVSARKSADATTVGVTGETNWADHVPVAATIAIPAGRLMMAVNYASDFAAATGRPTKYTSTAAGPRFTYHVDPRVDFFAGSWHTPSGKNALHTDRFYAGVAWKSTKLNRLQGYLGSDKKP